MAEDRDAKLFQVLRRQVRQDTFVYLVVAERSLILPEAHAPQPDHDVHDDAPCCVSQHIIVGPGPERLSRVVAGLFGLSH